MSVPGDGAPARLRRLALGLALAAGVVTPVATVEAQRAGPRVAAPTTTILSDDGSRVPVTTGRRGFSLFANPEDLAFSGMHMTGTHGWFFPNNGPCPYYFGGPGATQNKHCGLIADRNGDFEDEYFEISQIAGAPISDFRKIRAVHQGVNNMIGSFGYTAPHTFFLSTPRAERWGAADGQFGNLFSGVQSTDGDGSCLDNGDVRNGYLDAKVNLLAGSDCPATWARSGFDGPRPVFDLERQRAFQASPNTFKFDDYKLPGSAFDSSSFLGTFSTYGVFSDAFREQIQGYGGVTKLASGTPTIPGFPLGLDVRFDAWQFARPSLQNVVFWRLRMVNNSARLYGTGIDFDSLYYALEPGFLASGNQAVSGYADFNRNALIVSNGNDSRACNNTNYPRRIAGVITGGCASGTATPFYPYAAIMVLKSPIGDAKNRLFTQVGGPYYNPASPFADDTITFQHIRRDGFGALLNNTVSFSDRARFGWISSIEEDFMDGRPNTAFTAAQTFQLFQNQDFDGTNTAPNQRFSRMVPGDVPGYGKWDYNNDGIQDTVFVPSCGRNGCVRNFSDTLPNGMQNILGNVGNVLGTGPFKLKAGDTTEFLYAFIGSVDSASIEGYVNSTMRSYLSNFVGPSYYPVPTFNASDVSITNSSIRDSTLALQDVLVRIRVRQQTIAPDPYLASVVKTLQDTTDAGVRRLLNLNPGLLARVQQRVRTNFDSLLVYKSCDNGRTFIVRSNDCGTADRANPNGTPFLAFGVDTLTGLLKTTAFTDRVAAGRSYLYSFVTKTRGLGSIDIVDSIDFVGGRTIYGRSTLANSVIKADTNAILSPLARSGATTVTVYAPISAPAGTVYGTLDTVRVSGSSTQRFSGTTRTNLVPGTYTAAAANRFIITIRRDTVTGVDSLRVEAQRVVRRAATSATGTVTTNLVVDRDVYRGVGKITVDPTYVETPDSTIGSKIFITDTLVFDTTYAPSSVGYILARVTGDTITNQPYFIAQNATSVTTSQFDVAPNFPGFFVTPVAETTPRTLLTLRAPGDTLSQTVISANGVTLQNSASANKAAGGRYEVRWQGDAYGPAAPFLLAQAATLQPQVQASLAARPVADVAATDAATLALVRATSGASQTLPLIAAKVPFQVFGRDGQKATLAMFRRNANSADSVVKNSILLGTLGDTTRISIQPDVWVPGDLLYVIERTGRDSTVGSGAAAVTIVAPQTINGQTVLVPVQSAAPFVGAALQLGCLSANAVPARLTCNPLVQTTRGATGYLTYRQGYVTVIDFARPIDLFTQYNITASAQTTASRTLTRTESNRVLVVPNPYIVAAASDNVDAARQITSRIYFTNVPEQGSLRIYSVSGQFVQQLDYTQADLVRGTAQIVTGDLPYNLRTREGLQLSSGLYIFVLTPQGSATGSKPIRGKFVIIR